MAKREKRIRMTTPVGTAKFPWLTKPDTKFNSDGEYRVSLLFDPEEVADFLAELDKLTDQAVEKAKTDLTEKGKKASVSRIQRNEPYREEVDQDGEETGKVEVRFKMKALVRSKDGRELEMKPRLFDAKGQPISPGTVDVYGGSQLRVNFTINPYFVAATKAAGISLQLNAVQVIELVSGGGGNASFFGFDTREDGFDVSTAGSSDSTEDTTTDDFGDNAGDDGEVDF